MKKDKFAMFFRLNALHTINSIGYMQLAVGLLNVFAMFD